MNTHVEENIRSEFLQFQFGKADYIFNDTFLNHDRTQRRRHGQIWNADEKAQLESLFRKGTSLAKMCVVMQRPASGILSKLVQLKCLKADVDGGHRYVFDVEAPKVIDGMPKLRGFDPSNGPDFTSIERRIMGDIKIGAMDLRGHQVDAYRYLLDGEHMHADFTNKFFTTAGITMPTLDTTANVIETKTFIRGVEASRLSQDQIIQVIAEQEAQLQFLNELDAAKYSKGIRASIERVMGEIEELVEALDKRA